MVALPAESIRPAATVWHRPRQGQTPCDQDATRAGLTTTVPEMKLRVSLRLNFRPSRQHQDPWQRYDWEPTELRPKQVWLYPVELAG
jgi:hypothetical protein